MFCPLPILITSVYVKKLQILLICWQGKKCRCSHPKLIKNRSVGGMRYVDFRDYCNATLLVQLKAWVTNATHCLWREKKSFQLQGNYLYNWLISNLQTHSNEKQISYTIAASHSHFFKYLRKTSPTPQPISLCSYNPNT